MKRTLRRESKALEIAGREALGARRFGPVGMSGGARGRPRSTFLEGASQKRPEAVAASSRITPSIPAGRPASAPQAAGGRGMGPGGRKASSLFLVAGRLVGRRRRGRGARRHAPPFVGAGKQSSSRREQTRAIGEPEAEFARAPGKDLQRNRKRNPQGSKKDLRMRIGESGKGF